MIWKELSKQHPDIWVVIEVSKTRELSDNFIIDEVLLLKRFKNIQHTIKCYKYLRKGYLAREILIANTKNKELQIETMYMIGTRLFS